MTTFLAQMGVPIVPVFISVDPERDTPAKIKASTSSRRCMR
jgi:cytochrome oxidase Cu insertion factor (SCO1/SenC/PrrC family)